MRDTPISETAIVGGAIGAALTGMRPVAELMTINFAFVAMDHIVNEAAKLHYMFAGQLKLPLVIRTTSGGGRQLLSLIHICCGCSKPVLVNGLQGLRLKLQWIW